MNKIPILILHGWGLSAAKYNKLANIFKKSGFNVYLPPLPGFGKSESPNKSLSLDGYVTYVKNYIGENRLGKIILIGHSFGGRISLKLASKFPEKIKILILTGVPGFVSVSKFKIIFFLVLSKIGKVIFALPILSKIASTSRKILYRLAGSSDYLHTEGVMRETFKSIIHEDLVSSMRQIKVKTLLVWGELDRVVPVAVAEKMQKNIKGSRLIVVEQATHKLPYENPEGFMEVIKEYIL